MAVVALIVGGDEQIRALPGQVTDVERSCGSGLVTLGQSLAADNKDDGPSSMKAPTEILQQIYAFLAPQDFNAARHTCRLWFVASLDRALLIQMLRRCGWWSSFVNLAGPVALGLPPAFDQEGLMSRFISRECNLSNPRRGAFAEVGFTDLSGLGPGCRSSRRQQEVMACTVSLCGRYLILTHGQMACVYELNHVCPPGRSAWSVPLRRRQGMPLGFLRPATQIICPRRIISCSMDTSAGRYAVAFLMEGRVGMVCDVSREGRDSSGSSASGTCNDFSDTTSASGSGSSSPGSAGKAPPRPCLCHEHPPDRPPRIEKGQRSVYRGLCHPDDPPRSVAICPQRSCVAFGCAAGIELHWVDALTGQDLSRWFPLSSSSDHLYFLPARRGVDTAKKLRLISSASKLANVKIDSLGDLVDSHSTTLLGTGSTAVVSLTSSTISSRWPAPRRMGAGGSAGRMRADERPSLGFGRASSAPSADH